MCNGDVLSCLPRNYSVKTGIFHLPLSDQNKNVSQSTYLFGKTNLLGNYQLDRNTKYIQDRYFHYN